MTTRSSSSPSVTRRHLLLVAPAAALAFAAACKKGPPESCDASGLSADEVTARNALAYTDHSLDAAQICSKCRQFVPAAKSDACGSCKVLKGPVHPNGGCRAFVAL